MHEVSVKVHLGRILIALSVVFASTRDNEHAWRARSEVVSTPKANLGNCTLLPQDGGFWSRSELQLGASPVSASGVVTDSVVSTVSLPVGERAVLLDFLSQSDLLGKGLNRSHSLNK